MDLTVFVGSFDRYSIVWPGFCHGIRKYWPDCPWPIRFVTNYLDPPCGAAIKVGSQGGLSDWTERMRAALGQVETDVILAMLDDQWLIESADARALEDFATIMLNDQADYILLNTGTTRSKGEFELDSRLFILADNSRYRTVMQASFWRVGIFLDLLQDGETAWQFERGSALRSRGSDRFLAVKKNACLRYVERNIADYSIGNPVVRGKWTASAKLYAEREGLKLDFSRHPGESP